VNDREPRCAAHARRIVLLAALGTFAALPARLAAQGNVAVIAPPEDTLRSVTPTFVVQATGFSTAGPMRITLQLATSPAFSGSLALDTTIVTTRTTVTFSPSAALQEGAHIYYRALVVDAVGAQGASLAAGPKIVPPWITPIIAPPQVIGQPVRTRTPRFVWHSPQLSTPPGPWQYTIRITNVGLNTTQVTPVGSDTTYTPSRDLEPNAIYRWELEARVGKTVQATRVQSPSTFVVEDADSPIASTSLYPPFPNPFPSRVNDATCVWFDLRQSADVTLDVYDLRGMHVRRLLPNAEITSPVAAGRYGRGRTEFNEGCDRRFAWDGTDDRGSVVAEGVYLIRFRGDGVEQVKKVLFRGRP
jgi:hypothetical protein